MNREEIQSKIISIAAEQAGVPVEQVTPATHFENDLNFDSLDVVEFAMEVEDELGVSIPDDQVDKLKTVELVVEYVAEQLSAAPATGNS
jgi:acyl carrier protein